MILVGAVDLGTSRIRLGVAEGSPARLRILGDTPNQVIHGEGGAAHCHFSHYHATVLAHLRALARYSAEVGATAVHLGVTGQVSSLIAWDAQTGRPRQDAFPIWMDSTCAAAVPELAALWDGAGARELLGTCLPAASNWLAVKLRHALRGDAALAHAPVVFLQLQDALIQSLCGTTLTHPSAQISLVDHRTGQYAPGMLRFLGLDAARLPRISTAGALPLAGAQQAALGLPATVLHVAPQDTHAALFGLAPRPGDGLLLAGTSEIVGVCEATRRSQPPTRMVLSPLGQGWMVYGSSASGGASLDWLMKSVLRRADAADLASLTQQAALLSPGADGLTCLPYFSGERAPLWDNQLSGALVGVRAHHTDAHLLRAVLEGVAYARRQAAEALEVALPARFLAAGGGTASALWNRIRASILERPLAVMDTPDLALIGATRWVMLGAGMDLGRLDALSGAQTVAPEAAWLPAYRAGYARFLAAQQLLHPATRPHAQPLTEATHA